MCRLLGIISKNETNASSLFFDAKIPFKSFSERIIAPSPVCHNSGWGIASFDKEWSLFKEGKEDVKKYSFDKIRDVNSRIILIHLRHASVGSETTINSHPFIYQNWAFEHNGRIERKEVINYLNDSFKEKLQSQTDSEVYFKLILQFLEESGNIIESIKKAVQIIKKFPHRGLNFILSDGKNFYAFRGVSPDHSDLFDYYGLNYFKDNDQIIFSSDPLTEDAWTKIDLDELIAVDSDLNIRKLKI